MSDEIRDESGARLCAWCGGPIRQSGIGRAREYCRQSCRQRAYEERQIQKRIALANRAAVAIARDEQLAVSAAPPAAPVSSRDADADAAGPSRDEMADAEKLSRDETVGSVPEPRPAKAPAPSRPGRGRRLWDVPPEQADQMPLFGRRSQPQSGDQPSPE